MYILIHTCFLLHIYFITYIQNWNCCIIGYTYQTLLDHLKPFSNMVDQLAFPPTGHDSSCCITFSPTLGAFNFCQCVVKQHLVMILICISKLIISLIILKCFILKFSILYFLFSEILICRLCCCYIRFCNFLVDLWEFFIYVYSSHPLLVIGVAKIYGVTCVFTLSIGIFQ